MAKKIKLEELYEYFGAAEIPGDKDYFYFSNEGFLIYKDHKSLKANSILEKFYYDHEFNEIISFKEFVKILTKFILEEGKELNKLKNYIGDPKDFFVYKKIFGIRVKDKVTLGDFTVYNYEKNKKILKEKYPHYKLGFFDKEDVGFILEIKIKCVDSKLALEKADEKIEEFINFLYFITNNEKHKISVNQFNYCDGSEIAINESCWVDQGLLKLNPPLELDKIKESIDNHRNPEKTIKFLDSSPKNEIESVLKIALNWTGECLREQKRSMSLLKGVIALETIFSYNQGAIGPSILNLICESVAIVTGKDCDKKIEIEKELKSIYAIRSKIVHTGKESVLKTQKAYLIMTIKNVINALLFDINWNSCSTKIELIDKIKKVKYS